MRDFRDARVMASALRDALKAKSVDTTESESLELIATLFGFENWNALSPTIDAAGTPMSGAVSPPWARLRDALKAKGMEITLRDSVDLLVTALGYEHWKALFAQLNAGALESQARSPSPVQTQNDLAHPKPFYCSFCGKSQHEVRKMISGPTAVICDECVDLCTRIVQEEHIPSGGGTSPPTVN